MIQLSDHFDYKRLIKFTLPSIFSMIIGSVYSIVDGFFVSNFVGKTPFTALNLIFPFLMILGAVGNMIGVGGTALVAKTLGEGKREKANDMFSFFTYACAASGVVFAVIGINGIWTATAIANSFSAISAYIFMAVYKNKYNY